jgi:hypothetical protein
VEQLRRVVLASLGNKDGENEKTGHQINTIRSGEMRNGSKEGTSETTGDYCRQIKHAEMRTLMGPEKPDICECSNHVYYDFQIDFQILSPFSSIGPLRLRRFGKACSLSTLVSIWHVNNHQELQGG